MAVSPAAVHVPFTVSEYELQTPRNALLPPSLGGEWPSDKEAIAGVNSMVKLLGYAVSTGDSQKSPLGIKNKIILKCSRGGKRRNNQETEIRPGAGSKRVQCPFRAVLRLDENNNLWALTEISNDEHNHHGDIEGSMPMHRRNNMTEEIKKDIKSKLDTSATTTEILTEIQKKYNHDPNNPLLGAKDISNYIGSLRSQRLSNKTPIQALNLELHNDSDWFVRVELSVMQEVKFLFFCNKASREMLLHNGEILILDCTYKTNRYSMSLAVLTGVTSLNTSFYAGMCFMKGEKQEDYCQLIRFIKELYQELTIPLPVVWLSDGELNIPTAIAEEISPSAVHILCCWHLEQNVLTNCHKHFRGRTDSKEL